MTRIRLKYAIPELGGALYEVKLHRSHQVEETEPKTKRRGRCRPSSVPASEAQKIQRERFALAVAYAKAALADPRVRAIYEELGAKEGKCAYAAARNDYFKGNDLLSGM